MTPKTRIPTRIAIAVGLTVLFTATAPTTSHAWGFDGHRIVAQIAYERLVPAVKEKVDDLITESGESSFAEAATWGDRVLFAEEIPYDYRFSKKFHYINFSEELPPTYDNIGPACVLNSVEDDINGCVVFAIEGYASVLDSKQAGTLAKWESLLFVIHYVGDVHQPLHAGWAEDRGGNLIRVSLPSGYAEKHKNLLDKKYKKWLSLHKVWDRLLVTEQGAGGWKEIATSLNEKIEDADAEVWSDSTVADWAIESAHLALDRAYTGAVDRKKLKSSYITSNKKVVELRLQKAGVRLAALLNDVLAD